jgi:hypothetical protein
MARFCSLVTVAFLLAVPALRRMHPAAFPTTASADPALVTLGDGGDGSDGDGSGADRPAGRIPGRAETLLARLAPGHGRITVTRTISGRLDGSAQSQWCFSCDRRRRDGDEEPGPPEAPRNVADFVEVRYDGDTGKLVYLSSNAGVGAIADRAAQLTAAQAIAAARKTLVTLDLARPGSPARVLCPPQRFEGCLWQLWLRGHDTGETGTTGEPQGGPPLTVKVTLNAVTGDVRYAAVAERAAYPRLYLPPRPRRK